MLGKHPARLMVCTRNHSLAASLSAQLTHWAADCCVDMALEVSDALPETAPDLLFLDTDTVEAAGPQRPEALAAAELVVISRRPRHAVGACRWHAAAFLPSDTGAERLRHAMDRCFAAWRGGLQWLDLPARRERVRLPLCQLRYAEAQGRETGLFCAGGYIQVSVSLKKLEMELPNPPFFRCQKAFLVHLSAISEFSGGMLTMQGDGRTITVSRQQLAPLRQALAEWRKGEEPACASR